MRTLYVNPLPYGENIGIDAIAQGLRHRLAEDGIEMRTLYADFRDPDCDGLTSAAMREGVEAGVDAVIIYALTPTRSADAVPGIRDGGMPVFSFTRPLYRVNGSVIYPNFNHGLLMAEHMAKLVPPGSRVGVIGGPDTVDDVEECLGITHGSKIVGLDVVNDPYDPRYDNVSDVAAMGREVTEHLLDDFPDVVGLMPYNDETAHGSIEALRERGLLGKVKVVSRNGTPKAVEAVKQGWSHGTLDIDCVGIGTALGNLVARQLAGGEQLEDEIAMSPVGRVIGPDEADAWVPLEERIAYEPLREGLD
jgi:ABC-type sugar transport system substrate-binding protein